MLLYSLNLKEQKLRVKTISLEKSEISLTLKQWIFILKEWHFTLLEWIFFSLRTGPESHSYSSDFLKCSLNFRCIHSKKSDSRDQSLQSEKNIAPKKVKMSLFKSEVLRLRGYCTPDHFCDCLYIFLKNYNSLVTSKICFL